MQGPAHCLKGEGKAAVRCPHVGLARSREILFARAQLLLGRIGGEDSCSRSVPTRHTPVVPVLANYYSIASPIVAARLQLLAAAQ